MSVMSVMSVMRVMRVMRVIGVIGVMGVMSVTKPTLSVTMILLRSAGKGRGWAVPYLGGEPSLPAGRGGWAAFIWEGRLLYLRSLIRDKYQQSSCHE